MQAVLVIMVFDGIAYLQDTLLYYEGKPNRHVYDPEDHEHTRPPAPETMRNRAVAS